MSFVGWGTVELIVIIADVNTNYHLTSTFDIKVTSSSRKKSSNSTKKKSDLKCRVTLKHRKGESEVYVMTHKYLAKRKCDSQASDVTPTQ